MNLSTLLTLTIVSFIAFSIGLNLGLHGIMSKHLTLEYTPTKTDFSNLKTQVLQTTLPPKLTKAEIVPTLKAQPENTIETQPAISKPTQPPVKHSVGDSLNNPATNQPLALGASQWSKARLLVEEALSKSNTYTATISAAKSQITSASNQKPIETFISSGGQLPIVLLTSTRAKLLQLTLASLFSVRGVHKINVLVIQDGLNAEVANVVRGAGINLVQSTQNIELQRQRRQQMEGAEMIARHYKFALSTAFDRFPDAPALIIIEDDLLFSPDFYEYFHAVGPVLNADPSLFVISAWNDNGFKGLVEEPYALMRTEFFPGLGWLLPRQLYKTELEGAWPHSHWDHWLRSPQVHRGREIVYPQVPRTYHNGILGTFMNLETHNKYFRNIDYNIRKSVTWSSPLSIGMGMGTGTDSSTPLFIGAMSTVYEARVEALIASCEHVTSVSQILVRTGIYCLWVKVEPEPAEFQLPEFQPISRFFGLWHEHKRGSHRGLHELYFEGSYVLVLNIFNPSSDRTNGPPGMFVGSYLKNKPDNVKPLPPVGRNFDVGLLLEGRRKRLGVVGVAAAQAGLSCNQVCGAIGKSCKAEWLPLINSCDALREAFSCSSCIESYGQEQPSYVVGSAEEKYRPRSCFYNARPEVSTCDAQHKATKRLCACSV